MDAARHRWLRPTAIKVDDRPLDGALAAVRVARGSFGELGRAMLWRRRADADAYGNHIRDTGFAEYGLTPGNRGAWLLRRDEGERSEFITLSLWESEDAIRAFAGDDIEAAVL